MNQVVHLIMVPNKSWRVIFVNSEGKNTIKHFDTIEDAAPLLTNQGISHDEIDEGLIRIYTTEGEHRSITAEYLNGKFHEIQTLPKEEKVH